MRIAIGADHAGWALKELLKPELLAAGYEVIDVGAHAYDREDDYPDSAAAVARLVATGQAEKGFWPVAAGWGRVLRPTR